MISRIFLESKTISTKTQNNLNPTIFPIILISNINEIYVDNPHFLRFQIIKIKRYKSVFIIFLTVLGSKQFLIHKARLMTTNHINQ